MFDIGLASSAVGGVDFKVAIYTAKGGWVLCHEVIVNCITKALSWSVGGKYLGCGGDNPEQVSGMIFLSWFCFHVPFADSTSLMYSYTVLCSMKW